MLPDSAGSFYDTTDDAVSCTYPNSLRCCSSGGDHCVGDLAAALVCVVVELLRRSLLEGLVYGDSGGDTDLSNGGRNGLRRVTIVAVT